MYRDVTFASANPRADWTFQALGLGATRAEQDAWAYRTVILGFGGPGCHLGPLPIVTR